MPKETEERLIRALEFLKEPHGSTISTIVKAINGDGPQVSLKKIVQTLKGCLENGVLMVSDGRVKLKQAALADGVFKDEKAAECRPKSTCLKPPMQKPLVRTPTKSFPKKSWRPKCLKQAGIPSLKCDDEPPAPEGGEGGEEGGGEDKCKKKKPKPKCPKPKPKCPKPKPKCPKAKKPKPKPKPKCKKPKPKPKKPKKCPQKKKKKIQPYCQKKKKKCPM